MKGDRVIVHLKDDTKLDIKRPMLFQEIAYIYYVLGNDVAWMMVKRKEAIYTVSRRDTFIVIANVDDEDEYLITIEALESRRVMDILKYKLMNGL